MFFILSKTLDFLLSPLIWVILLLLLSILAKRPIFKKRFFYTGCLVLIIFSNSFLAKMAFRAWEGSPVPMASISNYETGIVLTGVASARNDAPDRVFFSKGADRILHTVQLYKAGKIKKILISGGSGALVGNNIPEASQLKKVFLYCGVPDSAILLENRSRNTVESARYTKDLISTLSRDKNEEFLLITSAFHIPRSLGCFRKVGLDVYPYAVDFYSNDRQFDLGTFIVPSEFALESWSVLLHEICGFLVYKGMGYS